MSTWPKLNNPPVVVTIFQLKYSSTEINLSDFLKYDTKIKRQLPNRRDSIQVGIDLGNSSIPLGVSTISATSDAKVGSYIYFSTDQKRKFEISGNTITYIDENPYQGWQNFEDSALKTLMNLTELLNKIEITRTSIRFINRFNLNDFANPQDYFKTLITSSEDNELPYPLRQYGFRLTMDVPNTDIHSIVNQNVENISTESFIYTFDIDVLDKQHLLFDKDTISLNMRKLREVKNTIFFNNITQKTIDLCN